jgi:hypothetical protein
MSDIPRPPTAGEVDEHLHSYFTFERLVLFAILHLALTLSCVALAFIGHVPVIASIFWLGGSVLLLAGFTLTGDWSQPH